MLVEEGACSAAAVREALQNQVIFGGRLGTNLLELGEVAEDALAAALGRKHGVPALSGELALDPAAIALVRPELADRAEAIPYLLADRRLAILAVDPSDLSMLDEVAFATGKQVHPIVVPEARIWALLGKVYGIQRQLRGIDFGPGLAHRLGGPAAAAGAPPASAAAGDLMDEAEFDAIYGKSGSYPLPGAPPAPEDGEEILDLVEVVEAPPLTSALLESLSTGPGHAPPARFVPIGPRQDEPEPSPLGFGEAVRFLEGVEERGAIARTVLRYARSRFRRAVILTVHHGMAQGWAGLGEKLGVEAVGRIRIALGAPGIVDTVVQTRAHFLGPIPKTEANVRLLKSLGGGVPQNALLVPILALGRVVNVIYADDGRGGMVDASGVGELLILATRIAKSYDALLARVR